MLYHHLGDLNKIMIEMIRLGYQMGFQLSFVAGKKWIDYKVTNESNEEFNCGNGIIYKYKEHENKIFDEIDEMIDKEERKEFNYYKGKGKGYKYGEIIIRNEYLCYECRMINNFYVCKGDEFLDTFCMHTDFLKDEMMCMIDE